MKLQKDVVTLLLEAFPSLSDSDIKSIPASVPGEDLWLSSNAKECIGHIDFEMKNQESLNIWSALEQCGDRAAKKGSTPVVVFKRNRSKTYACIPIEYLVYLWKCIKEGS